jgi:hypothetical protein
MVVNGIPEAVGRAPEKPYHRMASKRAMRWWLRAIDFSRATVILSALGAAARYQDSSADAAGSETDSSVNSWPRARAIENADAANIAAVVIRRVAVFIGRPSLAKNVVQATNYRYKRFIGARNAGDYLRGRRGAMSIFGQPGASRSGRTPC